MTAQHERGAGWDAKAIQRIARDQYGGMAEFFEAHGWPERGQHMLPAVQRRVAETYVSIADFERRHLDVLMSPFEAITSDPPNVWLTSYYGFGSRNWGFLGFSDERMRTRFLRETEPGVLVVSYGASKAPLLEDRKRVFGLQQMTHQVGHARLFMSDDHWIEKCADPERRDSWNLAIKACWAWQVRAQPRMVIETFAPITYSRHRAQSIGAWGKRLDPSEARRILDLGLEKVQVQGGPVIEPPLTGLASEVLLPSRPGPVSHAPYFVPEAAGPKHLYVLKLNGNIDALLGRSASGQLIVKVGFSKDPNVRCENLNRCLPRGVFRWTVLKATNMEGREPFPSSDHALAGEEVMKRDLLKMGSSLGGEFFLAEERAIEAAWHRAREIAQNWDSD